ncbi:hypothetical protein Q4E40_00720 [Pontibacter sp. BT731]|uniref:hypothetical protein n=1 Tax=Pontibacter coccineus TaxID=3063328 RepID=UPI0026E433A6|nr:hypothetical protein [Pontibacter sp. BT731]MDO6388626.1 hypothetical protein [Pontibacter sp. BT731]
MYVNCIGIAPLPQAPLSSAPLHRIWRRPGSKALYTPEEATGYRYTTGGELYLYLSTVG